MSNPLVSVIVTTRNNHATLDACLASVVNQTYQPVELIVVDRDSSDGTKMIARYYTSMVFNCGPARSAQRNFGAAKASGEYIIIIDAAMELTPHVIQDCVDVVHYKAQTAGIIIPEESFGRGFWARCKSLERSYYQGNDANEAARFFAKSTYEQVGGYDESMVSGEDWDMSARVRNLGRIERITSVARRNEEHFKLMQSLRKKYYYAGQVKNYLHKHHIDQQSSSTPRRPARYKLFFSKPKRLLSNPFIGMGMLFMKACETSSSALGYKFASRKGRA